MTAIGVLVPTVPGPPREPPEARPIGRAALALATEGIRAIFGDTVRDGRIEGHEARPGRWEPVEAPVVAFYDRFPSQRRAERFARITTELGGRPLGNSPALTALCRDKLACQQHLEAHGLVLPAVEDRPERFAEQLADWGSGFLKPRYGALGAGVRAVRPGDPLPATLRALLDEDEPAILQRAVPPPPGLAGRSVRLLAQREADGSWFLQTPVVRQSTNDPVVNAARGATLLVGDDLLSDHALAAMRALVLDACDALAQHEPALELGVDLVLDPDDLPHLIEVNSRPRGRLEKLAELDPDRFAQAHVQACARPIRTLASWYG